MIQKITKNTILAITAAIALAGCGGGGGGGGTLENSNSETSTKTNNSTERKVIMLEGKWETTSTNKFLKRDDMDHLHVKNSIYKKYDGEFGKGVMETSCVYYPKTANWGRMISYNGISCPYSTNNHGLARSANSEHKENEDDYMNRAEGDWAIVGNLNVDGVKFTEYFYGETSLPRIIIDPSLVGNVEEYNKIIKVNPSSDNRSTNCLNGENLGFFTSKPTSDIKFYRYSAMITNGVKTHITWRKNCIITSPINWYSKDLADVYVSDRDITVSAQIGKDEDKNVYITSNHYKKLD